MFVRISLFLYRIIIMCVDYIFRELNTDYVNLLPTYVHVYYCVLVHAIESTQYVVPYAN